MAWMRSALRTAGPETMGNRLHIHLDSPRLFLHFPRLFFEIMVMLWGFGSSLRLRRKMPLVSQ
jgi:hypothetical protein